jgi:hypothetical protein
MLVWPNDNADISVSPVQEKTVLIGHQDDLIALSLLNHDN